MRFINRKAFRDLIVLQSTAAGGQFKVFVSQRENKMII